MLTYCNIHSCAWACDDENYGKEQCTVDWRWEGQDYWGVDCDNFSSWLTNTTQWIEEQNCDYNCWERENCAENNTSYDYCIVSDCWDNCTYQTHCIVDWIDVNGYEESTDCDQFWSWANSTGDNFTYNETDDWDGECVYECAWSRSCLDDFEWFEICDVYDCRNNCTDEMACIVDWQDQNFNGDYSFCEDFYDTFGNDTDDEDDDEDGECEEQCSAPSTCQGMPEDWYWCEMKYCWNTCEDGVVSPDCYA